MAGGRIALQLYTLREELRRDFRLTLAQVAGMGYPAVEFAGYGELTPDEVRQWIDSLGLVAAGTHTGLEALERDFATVVQLHQTLGARYLTVPSLPRRYHPDEAGYRAAAADLEAMGRRLAAEGLSLCYHNHDREFFRAGDRYGLDILFGETDPAYLGAELDVYWVKRAGLDPAEYMAKLGSRCRLLHIKDMTPEGDFAEVGAGTIDFNPLFTAGAACGVDWYIVEQDACRARPPLEAVRLSLENLRHWGRL